MLIISKNLLASETPIKMLLHFNDVKCFLSNIDDEGDTSTKQTIETQSFNTVDNTSYFEIVDVNSKIFSYLDMDDAVNFSKTSKQNRDFFLNKPASIGEIHRKDSKFGIQVQNRFFYLKEFLQQEGRMPMTKINNLTILSNENHEDFMNLVLKTIPSSPETIEEDLEFFYNETMKIEDLIAALPSYETSQDKLSALLVEQETLTHVWSQVWSQIWTQAVSEIGPQTWNQIWSQVSYQVGSQMWNQVGVQVNVQIMDHLDPSAGFGIWHFIGNNVSDQVLNKNWYKAVSQVKKDLRKFNFIEAHQNQRLCEAIKPAINYAFMTYQLCLISILNSDEFKNIVNGPEGISHTLKIYISENIASNILKSLEFREEHETNYLATSQLNILNRHL